MRNILFLFITTLVSALPIVAIAEEDNRPLSSVYDHIVAQNIKTNDPPYLTKTDPLHPNYRSATWEFDESNLDQVPEIASILVYLQDAESFLRDMQAGGPSFSNWKPEDFPRNERETSDRIQKYKDDLEQARKKYRAYLGKSCTISVSSNTGRASINLGDNKSFYLSKAKSPDPAKVRFSLEIPHHDAYLDCDGSMTIKQVSDLAWARGRMEINLHLESDWDSEDVRFKGPEPEKENTLPI